MLSVWIVDAVREGADAAGLAPGVLDAGERQRAAAFHRSADRRCYVAAHVSLRLLLGAYLGQDPAAVRLVREPCPSCGGPHGRPVAEGREVRFSLSHSGDLALIALADTPVGADVERIPALDMVTETASALHPAEVAEPAALPEADRPGGFARVWVRKEACLKGLGTGLARDLSLDYVGTGTGTSARTCTGTSAGGSAGATAVPSGWTLIDITAPEGFAAAAAVQAPAMAVQTSTSAVQEPAASDRSARRSSSAASSPPASTATAPTS
ncbi:4'-phosphopantetheinyl transferase family protein [Streptomyces scopuliridis]|uniref:4'-phosphopantetheinyl transferase family protein n=1 Tax=Streptomyces scopuliridis TaxID=452529 RepID=UPI0036D1D81D